MMQALIPYLNDKEHVIWDWNGTLLADLNLALEIVNRLMREEGLGQIDLHEYKRRFGFPVIEYYRELGFNTEPAYFLQLCERFNDHFQAGLATCELWPGVHQQLAAIKKQGKTQSLLSASEHGILLDSIRHFGVEVHFDHVYGIFDKTAGSKVARGQELIRKAGIAAAQTVLIGDTDHDLEVGRALGVDVVLVDHGHQSAERLRQAHHTVVKILP